jgi:hypothetical protein
MNERSGLPDRVLAAIEIVCLGSWVGALAGFAFVFAPLAFQIVAPIDVHRFAALTVGALSALTLWGYAFGGIAVVVAIARALDAGSRRWDIVRALVIACALGLASFEQRQIVPRMKVTPIGTPAYSRLHQESTRFYGGALLLGGLALALAAGRRDHGRPFDEDPRKPRKGGRLLPLQFETQDRTNKPRT